MIPAEFALLIAAAVLAVGCLAGGIVGSVLCWLLRLRWNVRIMLEDMGTTALAMLAAVLATASYDAKHGTLHQGLAKFFAIGIELWWFAKLAGTR